MMKFSAHTMDYVNEFMEIPDWVVLEESLIWSGPLVMASAAGWYVGQVCRECDYPDFLQPYDRLTEYMSERDAIKIYELAFKEDI